MWRKGDRSEWLLPKCLEREGERKDLVWPPSALREKVGHFLPAFDPFGNPLAIHEGFQGLLSVHGVHRPEDSGLPSSIALSLKGYWLFRALSLSLSLSSTQAISRSLFLDSPSSSSSFLALLCTSLLPHCSFLPCVTSCSKGSKCVERGKEESTVTYPHQIEFLSFQPSFPSSFLSLPSPPTLLPSLFLIYSSCKKHLFISKCWNVTAMDLL